MDLVVCCCWTYHLEQQYLPEYVRDRELSIDNFIRQVKTFLFVQY